jgi:hypothetical protein
LKNITKLTFSAFFKNRHLLDIGIGMSSFGDFSKSIMKGLNKVNRTVTASVGDLLDPLSVFAQQTEKEKEESVEYMEAAPIVPVTESNEILASPNPTYLASTSQRDLHRPASSLSSPSASGKGSTTDRPPSTNYSPIRGKMSDNHDRYNGRPAFTPSSPPASKRMGISPMRGASTTEIVGSSPEEELRIPLLSGEVRVMCLMDASLHIISMGVVTGAIYMTNYRIVFIPSKKEHRIINPSLLSWLNIPLGVIEKLEKEKRNKDNISLGIQILVTCKDCRQIRINIKGNSNVNGDVEFERAFSLMSAYVFPNEPRHLFAYSHTYPNKKSIDLMQEFTRLGVFTASSSSTSNNLWRVSLANQEYKLCSSYPSLLIVPQDISDDELFMVASFRSGQRLPTLCWASKSLGTTLWRSSQPKAGVSGTCYQDEKFLDLLAKSNVSSHSSGKNSGGKHHDPLLFIVDCRSRTSAMANRAAGAGYESQANYINTRLEFYNIPNIHAVRDSYKSLTSILLNPSATPSSDITFSKQIEDTQWLANIRLILKASWDTATMLLKGIPVLVHCSHGWDRTAQVCAIAQLLLDPYYRTIEGFIILLEKDWLSLGHPFKIRCGHGTDKQNRQDEEISQIFLQFLDCIWQLLKQYPHYFEFNSRFILSIADHIYSCRFGNFLFSCESQRVSLTYFSLFFSFSYLFCCS